MDYSLQLYSARKFDLDTVLRTTAELGYTQVEGYGGLDASTTSGFGGLYGDLEGLKRKLNENGLSMPTAHIGLDLLSAPDRAMRVAEALGIKTVICPWIAPDMRPQGEEDWKRLGERLQATAQPFLREGLGFAYHNHDFEFTDLGDGRYPMDVLLETAPDVQAEADIAWIVRGNADPVAWLERQGGRVLAIHVKDIAPSGQNADEDGWADVGHGRMDWAALMAAARKSTGARYFVAEHDNPSDFSRFARRSIESMRGFGA